MCDLTPELGLSQPTVSFHLKKLVQAGLLEREQRGVWAFYTVNREVLPRLGRIFELEGAIGMSEVREQVREHYREVAIDVRDGGDGCCDSGCCGGPTNARSGAPSCTRRPSEPSSPTPRSWRASGAGTPLAVAELREGETVLDLGSGGGIDVLLSARRVGSTGHAYGLDMTDEMLDLARRNAADAGAENVEFLKGYIEDVPLPDASVDVIISNCVINLSADKLAVFEEMRRVLRPGGRIGISDVVASDDLSPAARAERGSLVGCIAGALSFDEYRSGLEGVGVRPDRDRADARRRRRACTRRSSGRADPDRMTAMPEPNDVPEVLFVCVHNAGRSQMAAALLEHHAGGRVRVRSAGTTPSDEIHPNVVEAMAERGLDVSTARPKGLRRTTSVRSTS